MKHLITLFALFLLAGPAFAADAELELAKTKPEGLVRISRGVRRPLKIWKFTFPKVLPGRKFYHYKPVGSAGELVTDTPIPDVEDLRPFSKKLPGWVQGTREAGVWVAPFLGIAITALLGGGK